MVQCVPLPTAARKQNPIFSFFYAKMQLTYGETITSRLTTKAHNVKMFCGTEGADRSRRNMQVTSQIPRLNKVRRWGRGTIRMNAPISCQSSCACCSNLELARRSPSRLCGWLLPFAYTRSFPGHGQTGQIPTPGQWSLWSCRRWVRR